jgi:hypothetical protein
MFSIGGYPGVIDPERGELHPWSCNQFLISEIKKISVFWDWLTRDCAQTGRPEIKQYLSLSLSLSLSLARTGSGGVLSAAMMSCL